MPPRPVPPSRAERRAPRRLDPSPTQKGNDVAVLENDRFPATSIDETVRIGKDPTLTITTEDMAKARQVWGDGKVAISKAFEEGGIEAAREVAGAHLDANYGYAQGPVLFKPTMASGDQTFRTTRAGALAYFCGHSDEYPLDAGFAIQGWREMESVTSAEFIEGDVGMWMGWIKLTDKDGNLTQVDKSFCYKKDENGVLRIVLHHSSLPYQP